MAFEKMEATRFQKIVWGITSLFLWLGLLAGSLIAIVSAYMLVVASLNGIRDWWHYQQPQSHAGWFIVILLVSGFSAFYCNYNIDERSNSEYQQNWLKEDNRLTAEYIENSKKPLSIWFKLGLVLWLLMVIFPLVLLYLAK